MIFIMMIGMIFLVEYYVKKHMDNVRTLQEQRRIAKGRVILKKYYNTGAAGSFLSSHPECVRNIHVFALVLVFAALFAIWPRKHVAAAKTGLSFLAAGGLSNLYDRFSKGYVVDYVSFGFGPKRFRKLVFNLADFFIFAGIALCMVQFLKKEGN